MPRGGVPTRKPTTSRVNLSALVKKAWGAAWSARDVVYQMPNGRDFVDSGSRGGIYAVRGNALLVLEDGVAVGYLLQSAPGNFRVLVNG